MFIDKSNFSEGISCFRCDCSPKVSEPSIKGPLYWIPPSFIPNIYKAKAVGNTKTPGTNSLEQSTIDHCMKKYMYLWLTSGRSFWSVPISVKNNSIYVWSFNKGKWSYSVIPLDNIYCFMCY